MSHSDRVLLRRIRNAIGWLSATVVGVLGASFLKPEALAVIALTVLVTLLIVYLVTLVAAM